MRIILIFVLIKSIISFNYLTLKGNQTVEDVLNYEKKPLGERFNKDLKLINDAKDISSRTSCLVYLRNSLYANNTNLTWVMTNTQHDKELVFNKALLAMYSSCRKNINEELTEKALNPDSVLAISKEHDELLLSFDQEEIAKTKPVFTKEEQDLVNLIFDVSLTQEKVVDHIEDAVELDPDYFDRNKMKFVSIGALGGLIIALLFNFILGCFVNKSSRSVKDNDSKSSGRKNKFKRN